MTSWASFDHDTPEEAAEREQSLTRINSNEAAALSLFDNILDEIEANPVSGRAGVDALANLVYRVTLAHRKASEMYAKRTYKPRPKTRMEAIP